MLRRIQWKYLGLTLVVLVCSPAQAPGYKSTKWLCDQGKLRECQEKSGTALLVLLRQQTPKVYFRYELLEAESLVGQKDTDTALKLLSDPVPPDMFGSPEEVLWKMTRGMAFVMDGRFDDAGRELETALEAARRIGSRSLIAEVEAREGVLAFRNKDNKTAEPLLRDALDQATREGNASLRRFAMGNLGVLLTQTFRLEEAVYWWEHATAEFRKNGDSTSVARATGNLGWALQRLGDQDAALHRFEEAEAEFEKTGNRAEQLIWLGKIGEIHFLEGEWASAEASYRRAADLARETNKTLELTWWLDNLAGVAIVRKDWARAESLQDQSDRLSAGMGKDQKPDLVGMNNRAAVAAGRGHTEKAEAIYKQVAGTKSDDPGPALVAHSELAALYAAAGRGQSAQAEYRTTIALVEQQRDLNLDDLLKLAYISSLTRFYQQYVEFLVRADDVEGALRVADSSHSRALRHLSGTSASAGDDYRLIARQTGSVLLEYWLAPERSLLWEITPNGIKLHRLPGSARIRTLVAQHNEGIEDLRNPLETDGGAGLELWDILVSPVAGEVAHSRRVIVVPDGSLYSLNPESLPVEKPSRHYFLQDATISVVPALWLLRRSVAAPAGEPSLLLIGDPEPSEPEFPRLAYAARELAEIEKHFPESKRVVLRGAAATRDAYARAVPDRYSMIHFSAHATSNQENPLQSAIVLSPAGGHLLAAAEVMNIPLTASLVTVSSCRSAGSRIYSGEGLVGLTWAFLRAGAHGVIAGLWDVPDQPTSTLMGLLYSGLARGERPEEALRRAKLTMVNSGPGSALPYNWAAFQHYLGSY